MSENSSQPPILSYAPPPPWHRRRWFRRIVRWFIILLIAVLAWRYAVGYGPLLKRNWYLRQARTYTAPADLVVYDNGPSAAQLLASDPNYRRAANGAAVHLPACVRKVQEVDATLWPLERPSDESAVLFLHDRTSPSGQTHLVLVTHGSRGWLDGGVVESPPAWRRSVNLRRGNAASPDMHPAVHTRFFAGQPDPVDPSRFSLPYEMDGQRGVIDGQMLEDRVVVLEARDGPLLKWFDPRRGTFRPRSFFSSVGERLKPNLTGWLRAIGQPGLHAHTIDSSGDWEGYRLVLRSESKPWP